LQRFLIAKIFFGGMSFSKSGNDDKCPFCNSDQAEKTDEEEFEELMKRVEANDAGAMYVLGNNYFHGQLDLLQDREKAMELMTQAAELGSSIAHLNLGAYYHKGGDSKKEKFYYEAAAMAGNEVARYNLGCNENESGNMERAVKHWTIGESVGCYRSMYNMLVTFKGGFVSRDAIDSTLAAYNNSCAEMRSEARDAYMRLFIDQQ
jgi:TPR repeat protein